MMDDLFEGYKERIREQREKKPVVNWTGTVMDYLSLVKKNPEVAQFAPGRIYNMIMKYGVTEVPESEKTQGYEDLVSYNFFSKNGVFGILEPIHDLMRFLKAAGRRTETGKRILMMIGPVSSGKSTLAAMLRRGLERDTEPIYVIDGCPVHDEPLLSIDGEDRAYWAKELGAHIDGHLCPVCQYNIQHEWKLLDDNGNIRWEDVPVVQKRLSAAERRGIATFSPADPKSQDSTELIGRVNMSKAARYGETHPKAFEFNGELEVGNRGMVEYIEILKADIRLHHILLTVAQEQLIKAPGFPQIHIDTLVVGHSNETEYDVFRSEKKNEALHDRIYPVYVPYNLKVKDEIEIYKKMIADSDFASGIHIAPETIETAARFAVLTRLQPSTKVSSKIEKMKLYNGETLDGLQQEQISIKGLKEEGRNKEGRKGISPRFIINALNVALGAKEDKKCLNPIDVLRGLRANFDHHIGYTDEEKSEYMSLLVGEKESIAALYKDIAKKEVVKSFLHAFEDQAEAYFENYIMHVQAYCRKEKVLDPITGEYSTPDEQLMRSIEEVINVPPNSKDTFRQGIFVHKSAALERGERFTYKSYRALEEAIEKKLIGDLKNTVMLTIADPTKTRDEKVVRRRNEVLERLKQKGYCEHCAHTLVGFVGEIMRREG